MPVRLTTVRPSMYFKGCTEAGNSFSQIAPEGPVMRTALTLSLLLLMQLPLSGHAGPHESLRLPTGSVCLPAGADPGAPSEWSARDATCASNACDPGPANQAVRKGGEKVAWYCSARQVHCASPHSSGVMKGSLIGSAACTCDPAEIADGRCQGVHRHAAALQMPARPACDPASPFEGCH